ncbi:EF-hand domain-containing protein [Streptomyces sp. URMC 127]|uniref:EF-hand domain-containing protein n=1 Tax=Streptomyces sp. URMC 127 TaxID=3423402 RepID=UPI003F195FCA
MDTPPDTASPSAQQESFFACKIRQWFGCFDADRDFLVTRNDFALAADRWSAAVGLTGDHELALRLRATLREVWDEIISPQGRYDETGATPANVIDSWHEMLATANHPGFTAVLRTGELACTLMDRDQDGLISEAEYTHGMLCGFLVPEATSREVFRYLDTDGDHRITHDDFLRGATEYMAGDDPSSPAAWVVGKVH